MRITQLKYTRKSNLVKVVDWEISPSRHDCHFTTEHLGSQQHILKTTIVDELSGGTWDHFRHLSEATIFSINCSSQDHSHFIEAEVLQASEHPHRCGRESEYLKHAFGDFGRLKDFQTFLEPVKA